MNQKILSFFLSLISGIVFSQISGTVSDDENNPLPGASVVIKGTTKGATTDFDGFFPLMLT